jgi:hypothetical protein
VKLRIVKARTATPDDLRVASTKIPSPDADHMIEGVQNPAQLTRRIIEHHTKERPREPLNVRPSEAPAPPDMAAYIKQQRGEQ